MSCASLLTDLFFRAAASFRRATAASARLRSAAESTGAIGGRAAANDVGPKLGAAVKRVKLLIEDIGRMWWIGGVELIDTATRLVMGHAVYTVPSSAGWAASLVSRRMLKSAGQ